VAADTRIILFIVAASVKIRVRTRAWQVALMAFHFWFQYGVNTQFGFDTLEDIEDTANGCTLTVPANSQQDFFRVNAFVKVPSHRGLDCQ
jgi:hypothetical protein